MYCYFLTKRSISTEQQLNLQKAERFRIIGVLLGLPRANGRREGIVADKAQITAGQNVFAIVLLKGLLSSYQIHEIVVASKPQKVCQYLQLPIIGLAGPVLP